MNETIRDLAKLYGVSLDDAVKSLENNGIIVLSLDVPIIDSRKMIKYSQIISNIKTSNAHPNETVRVRKESTVQKPREERKSSTHLRGGFNGGNGRAWNGNDTRGNSNDAHGNGIDKNERQKQLLGRDYVIFTHMALRKPITEKILRQVLEVRTERRTKTRLVVCAEAVDYVTQAAASDNRIKPIADALELLQKYNALTMLSGKISEENHAISSFIKDRELNESILVVGINRGLSTLIR